MCVPPRMGKEEKKEEEKGRQSWNEKKDRNLVRKKRSRTLLAFDSLYPHTITTRKKVSSRLTPFLLSCKKEKGKD